MHAVQLLHNFFKKSCPDIHSTRLESLMSSVHSLLEGRRLTLTSLGRSSLGESQVKNKIKRIDRLLGNVHLHSELIDLYKQTAHLLIGNKLHPIIIVDWASVDNRNKFHVLKASIAYQGRSITVYDHVEYKDREKKTLNNSHDQFIEHLAQVLPPNCKPIIVSDAGFTPKWFKRIEAQGWYWVGRIRGLVKMQKSNATTWETCQTIFKKGTSIPTALGEFVLSKKNPLTCNLYIYKGPKKGRKRKNRNGSLKKNDYRQDYAKASNEPWLLASNLPKSFNIAKKVVKIYKKRMQIEETFRDIKDCRYGIGIRLTLSNMKERVAVLLLIAALALLIFVLLGREAYASGSYKTYQANTITIRRVLSFWYLGQQVYQHEGATRTVLELKDTVKQILAELHDDDL